jgi:iron complex outermembrane recepter protein
VQNAKFDYPAWNFGLDWQASDDVFLYAATRGAAKAGGWNLRAGGLPAFAPEKVKDVELGAKVDLLDRRVRFNTALFHTWKTDNQAIVNSFVPGIGVTQYIQNNGKVRIWGIESELTVVPWEGMTISANGSLQDGKYVKGSYSEIQVVAGSGCTNDAGVANGCSVDLSGLPLLQLPKTQLNISATQRVPLGNGKLAVTGAYAYIGAQHFNAVKAADQRSDAVKAAYAEENRLGRIPGYGIFNGRIAYTFDEPNLEVAFYGRNIFDKKYLVRRFSDLYRQLGISAAYVGEPATYGVEATFRF